MKDIPLQDVVQQVKNNCNVSDALYGGNLSLCNMLLRLRQLYYHEHNLRPWQSVDNKNILSWIGERENLWDTITLENYEQIRINKNFFDPFDIEGINHTLEETGYIYGAGKGIFGKPQFFLGKLASVEEKDRVSIYHLDHEICTDLMPSFAMSQNNYIYIRRDSLIDFLFYRFRDRKTGSLLDLAFAQYGLNQATLKNKYQDLFGKVADRVEKIIIYHELAEINLHSRPWKDLLGAVQDKKMEMYLRAIKDGMADLGKNGTLALLLRNNEQDLILFYSAFMNGLYAHLIPELHESLHLFSVNQDFNAIENAREKSLQYMTSIYGEIIESWQKDGIEPVQAIVNKLSK